MHYWFDVKLDQKSWTVSRSKVAFGKIRYVLRYVCAVCVCGHGTKCRGLPEGHGDMRTGPHRCLNLSQPGGGGKLYTDVPIKFLKPQSGLKYVTN